MDVIRTGDHFDMRALVFAVRPQLPRPCGSHGRTKSERGSRYDLALGATLCAGVESALPPGTAGTNRSWRVDETYLRVAGKWVYLYRAVDSNGDTIDLLLSARRDLSSARRFLQKALRSIVEGAPPVINVDGNPSYPAAIRELKRSAQLSKRRRCRPVRYLNKIVEQDHRAIKRRARASQGLRSFRTAARTIQGIEMVNMIRKGQVRWAPKGDIAGQVALVSGLFGLAPAA